MSVWTNGMKLAAEKRFRNPTGPKVLVCTAAGREGINLQFARILFNLDLPWNPMDMEQRIGRIHRYGQKHTAQVYNLVLSDTIEGRIFLLLTDKLSEIARTLGKVDEDGNITEDLQDQILGQLSERLIYDQLYRDALSDPELKRTRQELEAALSNASEARKVVYELFQDLDRFSLDDYEPLADIDASKSRIVEFIRNALATDQGEYEQIDEKRFRIREGGSSHVLECTLDRDLAQNDDQLELMGIDHPLVSKMMDQWRKTDASRIGTAVNIDHGQEVVLTLWLIHAYGASKDTGTSMIPLAIDSEGKRVPAIEKRYSECFRGQPGHSSMTQDDRKRMLHESIEPALQRELGHRGIVSRASGYSADMVAWVEIT